MSRALIIFFLLLSSQSPGPAAQGYIIGLRCTGVEGQGFLLPGARSSRIQEHWMVSKSLGNKGIFLLDLSKPASAPGNFFYIIEPMKRGVGP